ncbi:MAG: hypothetical protein GX660_13605, partial [Clostridiaceae bacterium]|nr:hypothetical protein [Clostridiaceae bacterium]
AQGSTEGLTVRFSADTNIPMDKFQQMTAEQELKDVYFQEYISKLTRIWNLPVLRDPRSSVIDPTIEVSQNNQVLPLGNPRYDKVYRIARRYKQDSVLAVVNFQPHMIGEKIIIRNIAETYGIDKDTLNQYCFVNLLTGELVPIESNELELLPLSTNEGYFLGHDVYLYAIVHHSVINPPDI